MGIIYCKCLTCNHTGNVVTDTPKTNGSFVCSKCGSKNVISVYRDSNNTPAIHRHYIQHNNPQKDYYDDLYEYKIFEEDRLLDALMMAPTGWEDDEELQEYMGFSPKDILENNNSFEDHIPISSPHTAKVPEPKKVTTQCERYGCKEAGICKAPKNRLLNEYLHFCPKHAAEYNKNWNYYSNMTHSEIDAEFEQEALHNMLNPFSI